MDWKGLHVVVTGTPLHHSRSRADIEQMIRQVGAYPENAVNNRTNVLLIGARTAKAGGRKMTEARRLGVATVDLDDAIAEIDNGNPQVPTKMDMESVLDKKKKAKDAKEAEAVKRRGARQAKRINKAMGEMAKKNPIPGGFVGI